MKFSRRDVTALLALAAGVSSSARAAPTASGQVRFSALRSANVPGEVTFSVYTPSGYDAAASQTYPMLLLLHGGNESARDLVRFGPLLDRAIAAGQVSPLVVAMPSAGRSLYMDFKDRSQRWETFILSELMPHLRGAYRVSNESRLTFVGGYSMGGLGSLRLAFKHPDRFGAVAALEPAIEPALSWKDAGPYVKFWRPDTVVEPIFGSPVDLDFWSANNPASIARSNPDRLLGLGIYFDVGDQDMLYLDEGAEFLHRILFDAAIGHEYHFVHGADHVGPSLDHRLYDALGFIGRQIAPPVWIDDSTRKARAIFDQQKRAIGLPVEPTDPRRIRRSHPSGNDGS
jgi:S-formylglutathione hydrolase